MGRTQRVDSGMYNRPGFIQEPADYVDNGQGGNTNAGVWTTVRSPMVSLESRAFGRGMRLTYQFGELYPEADYWAMIRYANDVVIDAVHRLVIDNRTFHIIGAVDLDLEHVTTLLALVEYQSGGSI